VGDGVISADADPAADADADGDGDGAAATPVLAHCFSDSGLV
jgi:hypothetical protein